MVTTITVTQAVKTLRETHKLFDLHKADPSFLQNGSTTIFSQAIARQNPTNTRFLTTSRYFLMKTTTCCASLK